MAYKFNAFKKAWGNVEENLQQYKDKAEETKAHSARMIDMQRHVDMSLEKRKLLIETLNSKCIDKDKTLLEKGVLVYVKLLDVIEAIREDLEKEGINYLCITGKTSQAQRGAVSDEFMDDCSNTVVLISQAGGEAVDLYKTNEIILYNLPDGPGKFKQTIGRVLSDFGDYQEYYVHYIIVDETLDEYKPILLSSKKELEEEILREDTIPLKEMKSFDAVMLKKIRNKMLWKIGKKKRKPKDM